MDVRYIVVFSFSFSFLVLFAWEAFITVSFIRFKNDFMESMETSGRIKECCEKESFSYSAFCFFMGDFPLDGFRSFRFWLKARRLYNKSSFCTVRAFCLWLSSTVLSIENKSFGGCHHDN